MISQFVSFYFFSQFPKIDRHCQIRLADFTIIKQPGISFELHFPRTVGMLFRCYFAERVRFAKQSVFLCDIAGCFAVLGQLAG